MARIFRRFGIPMPEFQYELRTASGLFVARFDLYPNFKHASRSMAMSGTGCARGGGFDRDRASCERGLEVDHGTLDTSCGGSGTSLTSSSTFSGGIPPDEGVKPAENGGFTSRGGRRATRRPVCRLA